MTASNRSESGLGRWWHSAKRTAGLGGELKSADQERELCNGGMIIDDRGQAMEGMIVRVEPVSLLKNGGRPRAFQLAHPHTHTATQVGSTQQESPLCGLWWTILKRQLWSTDRLRALTDSGALQCDALRENGPFLQQRRRLRDGAPAPAANPKVQRPNDRWAVQTG